MSSVSPSRTSKDPAPPPRRPILAGGAVVTRDDELRGTEVLIIHRKRYDDWTLPKGKLEVAESLPACAVREVREETGVTIRLSAPLDSISYEAGNAGLKKVGYWGGVVLDSVPRAPDAEVDVVSWLPVRAALGKLTHSHDHFLVAAAPSPAAHHSADHPAARQGDGSPGLVTEGRGPAHQFPWSAPGHDAHADAGVIRSDQTGQFNLDTLRGDRAAVRA